MKWDDLLPYDDFLQWRQLLQTYFEEKSIQFKRAVKPPNTVEKGELIFFLMAQTWHILLSPMSDGFSEMIQSIPL